MSSLGKAESLTDLLHSWTEGDLQARERVMERTYADLCRLAAQRRRLEARSPTLDTHGLVHEVILRLLKQRRQRWSSRRHYFGAAVRIMRRVLVDDARRKLALRRGANPRRLSLDEVRDLADLGAVELVALDLALKDLERTAPDEARVVELRFFGGLTNREVADTLGASISTVVRRWRFARAWLYRRLDAERSHAG